MTTLRVGIASYEEMKARTLAVPRGERRVEPGEPRIWFTSTESFSKVLSARNREVLRVIADRAPQSLEDLAQIASRAKSNLSRTLVGRWSAMDSFVWTEASEIVLRQRSSTIGWNWTFRWY